jgi:hypothetical protein
VGINGRASVPRGEESNTPRTDRLIAWRLPHASGAELLLSSGGRAHDEPADRPPVSVNATRVLLNAWPVRRLASGP